MLWVAAPNELGTCGGLLGIPQFTAQNPMANIGLGGLREPLHHVKSGVLAGR